MARGSPSTDGDIVAPPRGAGLSLFQRAVLHPESKDIVLTPVSPHMAAARPLVLPPSSTVDLTIGSEQDAIVSVDGQVDRALESGDVVSICRSEYVARFVRFSKPEDYYTLLSERLDWLRVLRATEHPELFDLNGIPSS
jgi:NAD+ kinase